MNLQVDPKHEVDADADLLEDVCCITQGRCQHSLFVLGWMLLAVGAFRKTTTLNPEGKEGPSFCKRVRPRRKAEWRMQAGESVTPQSQTIRPEP